MTSKNFVKTAAAVAAIVTSAVLTMFITSPRVQANEDDGRDRNDSRVQQGFDIAPVPLNLAGKNRALVGLGSYLVNGVGDCNGCHNPGPGANEFAMGGNPFFGQTKEINAKTYLGGGRDFGTLGGAAGIGSAHIISRNLTPDKTGLPEGGRSFADFLKIMRTGVDLDNLHPTCPVGTVNANCVPAPFDGALLQVMPWFAHQNMTDHDLRAIYEYLSAIPCIDTIVAGAPQLRNDCGP